MPQTANQNQHQLFNLFKLTRGPRAWHSNSRPRAKIFVQFIKPQMSRLYIRLYKLLVQILQARLTLVKPVL